MVLELENENASILKWQDNTPNWDNRWSKPEDKLPNKRELILFVIKNKVHIGTMTSKIDRENWMWISYLPILDKQYHITKDIDYWMPLPEPPKEIS